MIEEIEHLLCTMRELTTGRSFEMLHSVFAFLIHIIQSLFGNIFVVCCLISLGLLVGELIWYRVKRHRRID